MADVVRINQTIYSWTSTLHSIDDVQFTGIKSVDWEAKRERKQVWAARQQGTPLGKTAGKFTPGPLVIKMLLDSALAFKQQLASQNNGSHGDAVFHYVLQYVEPDAADTPITLSFEECCIVGEKEGTEEGVEEQLREFEIMWDNMSENGIVLWSKTRALNTPQ